jgi:hypothetical protein
LVFEGNRAPGHVGLLRFHAGARHGAMTDYTEIRLGAIEFLLRGLWGYALAGLPEKDADALAALVVEQSQVWERGEGAPLREASEVQREALLTSAWVQHQIQGARRIEKELRRNLAKDKEHP